MQVKQYQPGDVIYQAGDASNFAYVLQEGKVEVRGSGGQVKMLTQGHLFGDIAVLKAAPRDESVLAIDTVTVKEMDGAELQAMLHQSPGEVQQLVNHLVEQSSNNNQPESSGTNAVTGMFDGLDRMTSLINARCEALEETMRRGGLLEYSADDQVEEEVLTRELLNELNDLGSLKPLLADESINDILVNGPDAVFVERLGKLEKTDITFPNDAEVFKIAEKIVRAIKRKIDPKRPLMDARLLDGSRVNIVAPPLSVDGTSISIRKFAEKKFTLPVMVEQENLSAALCEFLRICGKVRLNIVISGGTGSGKTTLLNAISQYIDPKERIVTIEDAAELQLQQPHVVRLETKPITSGASVREEVTMRDLVKNSLRMRPDRILVGEVRGPEAFDMMQAMNTGHEGSLTTIHANHPRDALSRLENMMAMANLNIPHASIRYQIASAINMIIQVSRMRDGHRRVTHVSEIVGMEGDIITMQDLFGFTVEGEDPSGQLRGSFKWTGIMPRFLRRIAYYGESDALSKALGVKLPKM